MENKFKYLEPIKGVAFRDDFLKGEEEFVDRPSHSHPDWYSFIIWNKLPEWFDEDPYLKYFKAITEKNFRFFKGLENIEIYPYDEIVTQSDRTTFTISHKEYTGEPIRKMCEKILIERENHTDNDMELTYIMIKPRNDDFIVEFSAEYTNVKISSIDVSEYEVDDTYSRLDCDINLSGYMNIGLDVDIKAKELLKQVLVIS